MKLNTNSGVDTDQVGGSTNPQAPRPQSSSNSAGDVPWPCEAARASPSLGRGTSNRRSFPPRRVFENLPTPPEPLKKSRAPF